MARRKQSCLPASNTAVHSDVCSMPGLLVRLVVWGMFGLLFIVMGTQVREFPFPNYVFSFMWQTYAVIATIQIFLPKLAKFFESLLGAALVTVIFAPILWFCLFTDKIPFEARAIPLLVIGFIVVSLLLTPVVKFIRNRMGLEVQDARALHRNEHMAEQLKQIAEDFKKKGSL